MYVGEKERMRESMCVRQRERKRKIKLNSERESEIERDRPTLFVKRKICWATLSRGPKLAQ